MLSVTFDLLLSRMWLCWVPVFLNFVMLNVIMLSVVAPTKGRFSFAKRYESAVEAIDKHSSLVQY